MRRLFCLLLPLLCAAAPLPSASTLAAADLGSVSLSADSEQRWVAFDLTPGNQIRFAMTIDGRAVTAILDTGVSFSLLARGSPAVVSAKVEASGNAAAIGGPVAIGWMPTASITLGGLTRTGSGVTVADLPAIATGSTRPVDLLVGRDLIGAQALDIDYANRRFRLLRSGRLPFTGAVAPLAISPMRRVYESAVTLGGRTLQPMVVDTGDGSSITVTQADWRAAAPPGITTTNAIAYGLAGPVVSDLAIVPALRLGQLVAQNVEVRVEPADGFSQSIGTAGRIGSGFLQRYRVLLDPAAGRMVLSPNPGADDPPQRSTSGILVGVEPNGLKVLHVMRGGPAAAAGWHDGDLICAIDGTPVSPGYASSPLATWSIGTPGRVVALKLCDGSERKLTLQRFY